MPAVERIFVASVAHIRKKQYLCLSIWQSLRLSLLDTNDRLSSETTDYGTEGLIGNQAAVRDYRQQSPAQSRH